MREVNCLTLSQILMTDFWGFLEGITDMVGSIQEFLQRQARHIEERDAILLHQHLELILLQVLLAFAQFIEIK